MDVLKIESEEFSFEPTLHYIEERTRDHIKQMRKEAGITELPVACRHFFGRKAGCIAADMCKFSHIKGEYPMPICMHYMNPNRGCSKGKECPYRHVAQKCNAYQRGYCPRGPKCTRLHEHIPRICPRIWKQGWCWDEHCKEAHPLQDEKFWKDIESNLNK